MLRYAHQSLLHLFFPHLCAGCGSELHGSHQLLCLSCIDRLPVADFHRHAGNPAEMILRGRLPLLSAMSYLFFTKDSLPRRLLHQLKYNGRREIGRYFGARIGEALLQSPRFSAIDALIPLPLYASREKKRGYNQATILSEGIGEQLGLPVLPDVITRVSDTGTQTARNRLQRWQYMQGRFLLKDPAAIAGRHLLLVDDVITTGATLEACGQELLKAPGVRLSIATLAFAAR